MMNTTTMCPIKKTKILFITASLLAMPILAQNNIQNTPPFKSTRTTVHQAIQKDTAWAAGAVVDQIHFVRYDRNGRKIVENSLKPDGSADSKIIFVYDKAGNVIEEVIASIKKGGVSDVYQYHYDAQGRMDGKKKLNAQRTVVGIDTIIRNEAGLIIQRIHAGVIYSPSRESKERTYREAVNILYNDEGRSRKSLKKVR